MQDRPAGNLLNDGTHSYTYDAENHIIKVDGGSTGTYTYDADGRRVETINSQGTMEKIYDRSDNVIADWQATAQMQGGWDAGYVYLGGRLAAVYEGGTTYFVGTDHLGSARGMVATNGSIVDAYHYLPFGELLQGGTYTTHKFTGFERDSETNLDFAKARHLGSTRGRFLSPDPHNAGAIATSPQTWNAYVYVSNNPLTLTDPTGMMMLDADNNGGYGPARLPYDRAQEMNLWVFIEGADPSQAPSGKQKPAPTAQDNNQQQQPDQSQASSTHFASVSFWPSGAGHLGHTGVGVDTDDTSGFVPATHHSFWAILTGLFFGGRVQDDIQARTNPTTGEVPSHSYLHIPISAAQAAAMNRAIANRRENPGSYSLYFRNCAGFVEHVLHAGGVGGVPHSEIFFPPVLYGMLWYVNSWR